MKTKWIVKTSDGKCSVVTIERPSASTAAIRKALEMETGKKVLDFEMHIDLPALAD